MRLGLCSLLILAAAPWAAAEPEECVLFSINVQDFSYPDRSAAVVRRILDLHEKLGVPVDVYLTSAIAECYQTAAPDLLDRLAGSKWAAASYHVRPPAPYYTRFDWLGLGERDEAEQREIVRRYEEHAVDPRTGRATDRTGGYSGLAQRLGYAPWICSLQADRGVAAAVHAVFRELGARCFAVHGRAINLGERLHGLPLRPEHVDLKLFQHVGQDAAAVMSSAFAEARRVAGARAPYFVGVKMHDNDFFAVKSAWTTVYLGRNRSPDWDLSARAALLSEDDQAAAWSLYESAVRWVAGRRDTLRALNAPRLLALLGGESGDEPEPPAPDPDAGRERATDDAGADAPAPGPRLLVSGTIHIESNRRRWADPDALLEFLRRATATGMRWSVGADLGWLEGEPRAAEVIRATEAMGVELDVHAHRHEDRARCAAAITRFGGHPTSVASGVTLDEVDALREPVRSGRASWQAEVLWGIVAHPWHGRDSDLPRIGVWRPRSGERLDEHDPRGDLIAVGGGPLGLAEIERLADEFSRDRTDPVVLSASIMVAPNTLTRVNGAEGIAEIEAWAARVSAHPQVRWATIAETAAAWKEAGGTPSCRTVEVATAPGPRRRR